MMTPGDVFIPFQTFAGDYLSILRNIMDGSLSRSMKRMLIVLNSFACEDGHCYPSQDTIGRRMGHPKFKRTGRIKPMGARQVRNILRELEAGGWIRIVKPTAAQRRRDGLTDRYFFLWHRTYSGVISGEISADTPLDLKSANPKVSAAIADWFERRRYDDTERAAKDAIMQAADAVQSLLADDSRFVPARFAAWAANHFPEYPLESVHVALEAIGERVRRFGGGDGTVDLWGYGVQVIRRRGPMLAEAVQRKRHMDGAGWLDSVLGGIGAVVGSGAG